MAERLTVTGARGPGLTEIARRTGSGGVLPTDSDTIAIQKVTQGAIASGTDAQPGQFLVRGAGESPIFVGSAGTGSDAALRTELAAPTGSRLTGFRQSGSGAAPQSAEAKLQRRVDVDDYRLAADTDDTASFGRAVAALTGTGGEIRLDPKKRYLVSGQTTVSSLFHIAFVGAGFGQVYDANGPGIAYTTPMASLFRVQAPGTRSACGGVSFTGISFYDATGSGGSPGSNTISTAVLDLYDAPLSKVVDCQFHFIKGSAIKTDFFVQSSITGCRIRYSGAVGKNVLHLGATDTSFASQSVVVHDCRIEVCYGNSYLYTDPNSQSITLSAVTFEAATVEYPASAVPFLDLAGDNYKVVGCAINRNTAQAVILRGRGVIMGCSFSTGVSANESIFITGARNIVMGCPFTDTRTGYSIRVTGVLNTIVANRFYASGGVSLEGANNKFNDNIVDAPMMNGGGYALVLADYCTASGNDFNGYDFSGTGYVPAVNAAVLYGINALFSGNACRGWTGKTFIRVENTTASFPSNVHDGVGTFATTGVALNTVPSAATLVLPYGPRVVTVTGTTTITQIAADPQRAGTMVTLVFPSALTVSDTNNIKLSANFASSADDTLTLGCDGVNWYEIARSVN